MASKKTTLFYNEQLTLLTKNLPLAKVGKVMQEAKRVARQNANGTIKKANDFAEIDTETIATLEKAIKTTDIAKIKQESIKVILAACKAIVCSKEYDNTSHINDTFTKINNILIDKWFKCGDLKLSKTNEKGVNGYTYHDGRIFLKSDRLKWVIGAMNKIAKGNGNKLTYNQADAMATFWHEITHNRNNAPSVNRTDIQTKYMELANEYIARNTLPEFYEYLGCKTTPFSEFMITRASTGYNRMVTNYEYIINRLNLNEGLVINSVRNHLYSQPYNDQEMGLKKGLIDGGLKQIDGQPIADNILNEMMELIRTQWDVRKKRVRGKYLEPYYSKDIQNDIVDKWLKDNNLIE